MRKQLAKVEVLSPGAIEQKLDDFLVFDARSVDRTTRIELQRILPKLLQMNRAWSAHFEKYGCIGCRTGRPDSIHAIAARLRRRGLSWPAIFSDVGPRMTARERWNLRVSVRHHLMHPDVPEQESSVHMYGGGGFCQKCRLSLRRQLLRIIGKIHEGRDAAQETVALTRRFDVAQSLLNGDDE